MSSPDHPALPIVSIALAALVAVCGCSRSAPSEQTEPVNASLPAPSNPMQADDGEPRPQAESTDDPATEYQALADALAAGHHEPVADAVPERYREAFDHWWRHSVQPVDASARREAAEALAGFVDLLGSRRELILESDRVLLEGDAAALVRRRFDSLSRVIAATARWPGWFSERAEFDFPGLMKAVARSVASEPDLQNELRSLRFETVSRSTDDAIIRVRWQNDGRSFDLPVVRVGDRWIPVAWADWLAGAGAGARSDKTDRDADPVERARRLRAFSDQLVAATTALEGVATQSEFDARIDRAAMSLMAAAGAAESPPRTVASQERVTVQVLGTLGEDDKDRLLWEFVAATDDPASGIAEARDRPDGNGLQISIGPIADAEAFSRRLSNVVIESIDAERRTITVRVAEP